MHSILSYVFSALPGCHHQGIFVVTQVVPSKWSNVYSTDAHQRSN